MEEKMKTAVLCLPVRIFEKYHAFKKQLYEPI